MIFLIVIAVIFAYAPTAVWMLDRGGVRKLWLTFGIAFFSIVLFALVVSKIYDVRNTAKLVLFVCGFGGSTLLLSTVFLHLGHYFHWGKSARAFAAIGGAIIGVLIGMLLVVYGLRSW